MPIYRSVPHFITFTLFSQVFAPVYFFVSHLGEKNKISPTTQLLSLENRLPVGGLFHAHTIRLLRRCRGRILPANCRYSAELWVNHPLSLDSSPKTIEHTDSPHLGSFLLINRNDPLQDMMYPNCETSTKCHVVTSGSWSSKEPAHLVSVLVVYPHSRTVECTVKLWGWGSVSAGERESYLCDGSNGPKRQPPDEAKSRITYAEYTAE